MKIPRSIQYVVETSLCTGCATCVSLCPREAIKLTKDRNKGIYVPKLDREKCNNCGICYRACPGLGVDFKQLNNEIFERPRENYLIGTHIRCYIGHSTNRSIRYNSSSGGLITQLLIFALEQHIIDGALITRMKKDNPLEPEPFIARTKMEVIEASKSKYCPVPANLALKEIINEKADRKYAVVGLPCHIHGVRKAERLNRKLKDKIVLHLGIFCSHNVSFLATERLLSKYDIRGKNVKRLSYRGRGWPGKLSIELKNGREILIPYSSFWNSLADSFFFTPTRCMLCPDQTNELADISFGDAWLKYIMSEDTCGTSILISRSNVGELLLKKAKLKKKIDLEEIRAEDLVKSQFRSLFSKKLGLTTRMTILRLLGVRTPTYEMETLRTRNILLSFVCLLQLLNTTAFQRKSFKLFYHVPILMLRALSVFFYFLELICYKMSKPSIKSSSQNKTPVFVNSKGHK